MIIKSGLKIYIESTEVAVIDTFVTDEKENIIGLSFLPLNILLSDTKITIRDAEGNDFSCSDEIYPSTSFSKDLDEDLIIDADLVLSKIKLCHISDLEHTSDVREVKNSNLDFEKLRYGLTVSALKNSEFVLGEIIAPISRIILSDTKLGSNVSITRCIEIMFNEDNLNHGLLPGSLIVAYPDALQIGIIIAINRYRAVLAPLDQIMGLVQVKTDSMRLSQQTLFDEIKHFDRRLGQIFKNTNKVYNLGSETINLEVSDSRNG